jgi:hypothetical protein
MSMTPAKSSNEQVVAVVDTANAIITAKYDALVTAGELQVALRRRTILDERYFRQLLRVCGVAGRLDELAEELGYPAKLVDDELTQFIYHSSQVVKAVGVEYASYTDDWEVIKRKFAGYIATPGIDDLWAEVNRAINTLERNPNPITAPGVDTQALDPKPEPPAESTKRT